MVLVDESVMPGMRMWNPLGRVLGVAAMVAVAHAPAIAEEAASGLDSGVAAEVAPLPDRLKDQREIEDLKREREKEQVRNEVEALRGLQTPELETIHIQLEKLKSVMELNREVRELLQASPELGPIYQKVIEVDGGAASCDCLDRIELNYVGSGTRTGLAILSLDGQAAGFSQGDAIGSTACRVGDVGDAVVRILCGGAICAHRVGRRPECSR